MQVGICVPVNQAPVVKAAGWDFIEENVQSLLQGSLSDAEWKNEVSAKASALPILAANCLVPGNMKITGPEVNLPALENYMKNVLARAGRTGMKSLVFGSGGARNIPEGFDRAKAKAQIIAFLRLAAPHAAANGVVLVIEPLNQKECNVIISVKEAMEYVRAVNHAGVKCLVDSYHFWEENEPLENLREAMPWIAHVHVADRGSRVPPGESGREPEGEEGKVAKEYRAFFRVLKDGKYDGPVSVEAKWGEDISVAGKRVREFLVEQWKAA